MRRLMITFVFAGAAAFVADAAVVWCRRVGALGWTAQWERRSGQQWYRLSAAERAAANRSIAAHIAGGE